MSPKLSPKLSPKCRRNSLNGQPNYLVCNLRGYTCALGVQPLLLFLIGEDEIDERKKCEGTRGGNIVTLMELECIRTSSVRVESKGTLPQLVFCSAGVALVAVGKGVFTAACS